MNERAAIGADPAAALARYRGLMEDWPAFCEALSQPLPTCLAPHPGRIDTATAAEWLARSGYTAEPLEWLPGALRLSDPGFRAGARWEYLAGLYQVQEEASLLPAAVLAPKRGERVLDLCAAPGSKTTQIAFALGGEGTVVANDKNEARNRAVRSAVRRLGLANVVVTSADGGTYPNAAGRFDKVLVDAPCTCEGTSRKNPRVLAGNDPDFVRYCRGVQRALLRRAVGLCRPGGQIVYATCTYDPAENEAVVDAVLREFGSETLRVTPPLLPGLVASPGVTQWQGQRFLPSLADTLRVWPHQNDTGGFFVASLTKQSSLGDEATPYDEHGPDSPMDPGPWLDWLSSEWGLAPETLRPYLLHRGSNRYVYLAARGMAVPKNPVPDMAGVPFVHTQIRPPKPTTAHALMFARHAGRNVVDLNAEQARAYLQRETFPIEAHQCQACSPRGFVMVRFRGLGLGVGDYRADLGTLRSLFPKAWVPVYGVDMGVDEVE